MSMRQNHIHVTRGDWSPRHVPNPFSQGLQSQGRPTIGCRSDMSQVHVTQGDGMCMQHFVAVTCRMNSNWFEFMRQVAASNCIKTYMSHKVTCRCDRTLMVMHCTYHTGKRDLQDKKLRGSCWGLLYQGVLWSCYSSWHHRMVWFFSYPWFRMVCKDRIIEGCILHCSWSSQHDQSTRVSQQSWAALQCDWLMFELLEELDSVI